MCLPSSMFAQEYIYNTYSVSDGLPVPELSCTVQDSSGYIWIGTHNGFSRYDGNRFTNYLNIDSSKVGFVNRIRLGKNKDLFICTNNGLIIKNESNFYFINKGILKDQRIYDIAFNDEYIFLACTKGIYKSSYSKNISDLDFKALILSKDIAKGYEDKFRSLSYNSQKDKLWLGTLYGVYSFSNNEILAHKIFSYKAVITSIEESEEKIFFSTKKNSGYVIANEEVKNLFSKGTNARNLHASKDKIIYIANDSLRIVDPLTCRTIAKKSLQESGHKFFLNVFEDREENLWLSTWEGLLKISKAKFKQFDNLEDQEFYSSLRTAKNLLIGGNKGRLYKLNASNDSSTIKLKLKLDSPAEIFDMLWFHDHLWIATGYDGLHILDKSFQSYKKFKNESIISVYKLKIIDGKLFVLTENGLSVFTDLENHKDYSLTGSVDIVRFRDIVQFNETYWICTDQGLYKLDKNGSLKFVDLKNHNISKSPYKKIVNLKDGHFLLSSLDQGLMLVEIKDGKIFFKYNILEKFGVKEKNILDLIIKDNMLYVSTHSGIYKILVSNNNLDFTLIEQCLHNDGFIKNAFQTLNINFLERDLWVATTNGIGYWKDALAKDQVNFPTLLTEITYENKQEFISLTDFNQEDISIPKKAKNIRFYFSDLSFRNTKDKKYLFKLEEYGDDLEVISKNHFKEFPKLSPGKYMLEIANLLDPSNSTSYKISKEFPFYKTPLFYFLILSLAALLLYSIHKFRLNKLENKYKAEQIRLLEINSYELKTLRAQMDPHFLFNTLNSIENFILKNDIKRASLYLNKFSTLVRKFLNQSKLDKISLTEVIDTLKEYIELEMMRYEGKFSYSVYIDPNLDPDFINITPVLIQPFVENAIWHGLHPKKNKGILRLKFLSKNDEYIICMVKDDGVGREASKLNKVNTHHFKESMGLQLIKRRLETINKLHNKKGGVDIRDLKTPGENINGTEVVLTLPIM